MADRLIPDGYDGLSGSDKVDVLRRWLMRQEAQRFLVLVGLIAEEEPEVLRRALASVFDTASVEETQRAAVAGIRDVYERVVILRDYVGSLERRVRELEERLERSTEDCP